jgi:GH3 auxin-responsive promoter
MRGIINDCLRRLIALGIKLLGLALAVRQRIQISTFGRNQKRLKRRYRINPTTPILTFGPEQEQFIEEAALRVGPGARFAFTSGSTAKRKRILYTKRRLRAVRLAYVDFFARCCWSRGIDRTSLYVFSSVARDDSLTSMLLEESDLPSYLSSLQAPYRVHRAAAMQSLITDYGVTAVRLWILAISNPGVLYSTNPSTLSTFLDQLTAEWQRSSELIKDWCRSPEAFSDEVRIIARRLESRGSHYRLRGIARSEVALPLSVVAPACEAYICWSGGYVKPFLDRLANHLPTNRYQLIPMYSMSTESLETVGHFNGNTLSFLPLANHVLYEFIEEGLEDQPQNLQTSDQLTPGKTYSMVVSDRFGLRRYQTGDLFLCSGVIAGLPDLRFIRRRDLEYSFTGEKLTGEHVTMAFDVLRKEYDLGTEAFLTCVPSQPAGEAIPHYKIILVDGLITDARPGELARRCDELFSKVNAEYRNKHQSGRLGRVRFLSLSRSEFIKGVAGRQRSHTWEAQFKFLPLYRSTWESLMESEH